MPFMARDLRLPIQRRPSPTLARKIPKGRRAEIHTDRQTRALALGRRGSPSLRIASPRGFRCDSGGLDRTRSMSELAGWKNCSLQLGIAACDYYLRCFFLFSGSGLGAGTKVNPRRERSIRGQTSYSNSRAGALTAETPGLDLPFTRTGVGCV